MTVYRAVYTLTPPGGPYRRLDLRRQMFPGIIDYLKSSCLFVKLQRLRKTLSNKDIELKYTHAKYQNSDTEDHEIT